MSYILDALRKADAERHLGTGAAQADFSAAQIAMDAGLPPARRAWPWMALCLGAGALTAFVGWNTWQARQPAPTAPMDLPPAQTAPAAPKTATEPAPAPARTDARHPEPERQHKAEGKREEAEQPAVRPKAAEPRREKPHPRKEKKVAPVPAPQDSGAANAPASLPELPPAIRQQLPALTVNGYLYSSNPADRSVLINNRLLREGDTVAPELVLEKLEPKSMVLNFRGNRYRSSY